jgi:hypothetical protein
MSAQPLNFDNLDQLVTQSDDVTARYVLYGGEVELLFIDNEKEHLYVTVQNGVRVPAYGVTSITGCADKPALKPWVANVTTYAMGQKLENLRDPLRDQFVIPTNKLKELLEEAKGAYTEIQEISLDIGKIGHDFIEGYLKAKLAGRDLTAAITKGTEEAHSRIPDDSQHDLYVEQVTNCISGLLTWCQKHNFRPLHAEQKLYSRLYNYAGTMDADGLMDSCSDPECSCYHHHFKDALVDVDWKSSRDFYPEYALQLSAYEQAKREMENRIAVATVVVVMGKYDGHVKGHVITGEHQDKNFNAFLGLMGYYDWHEDCRKGDQLERAEAKVDAQLEKATAEAAERCRKLNDRMQAKAAKAAEVEQKRLDKQQRIEEKKALRDLKKREGVQTRKRKPKETTTEWETAPAKEETIQ